MIDRRRLAIASLLVVPLLADGALRSAWAEAAASQRQSRRPDCDRAQFRVVVDVGHTAEVPGATSARGVPEYEFNLRLANRIGQKLTGAGFGKTVVLVTAGRTFGGLRTRVERANGLPADLFLSVHHDSVPEWFLETWDHEGKQRPFSDRFRGHSLFISHENGEREASLAFAQLLGRQLKARGLRYTPHYTEASMAYRRRELLDAEAGVYRYDQLLVLKNTRMPAVLLEAGSIINREEETLMASPERQSLIGAAVAEAVERFCAARSRRS
jgi:N-acetylmuramoyl-L-alanine amidase